MKLFTAYTYSLRLTWFNFIVSIIRQVHEGASMLQTW